MSSPAYWRVIIFPSFNPRPPKRTLCLFIIAGMVGMGTLFQSTSSEEDVVSVSAPLICTITNWFQSTSSEEDVVSTGGLIGNKSYTIVSIHVLRRGRCVGIFICIYLIS